MLEAAEDSAPASVTPRLKFAVAASKRLAAVELALDAGACLAITGPSGAGKSVLLRMIADLDPHPGKAWVKGAAREEMTGPEWRRQVIYCPAESGWWHEFIGAHFEKPYPLEMAQKLGLGEGIFDQEVRLCSTGERQRLSLLRSFTKMPAVLLLDEPTGQLDPENVTRVEAVLAELLLAKMSIVIVTHDVAQVRRLGAKHLTIQDGKLTSI